MRALEIVYARLCEGVGFVHKSRWQALWRVVTALIVGRKLWLTALGRSRPGGALPKHAIKAVDRLLGSEHLHAERFVIAARVAETLIGSLRRPIVLVDTVEIRDRMVALTAAVAYGGRSFPIWSMHVIHVRPNARDCKRFLSQLSYVLPPCCEAVIVTDAGFEGDWFDEVQRHGWSYVGRLRGQVQVLLVDSWVRLDAVRNLATKRAKNLGVLEVGRRRPRSQRVILSKTPTCRHRQVNTRRGPARGTNYHVYRSNAYEPLVLVTSLACAPDRVVATYKLRMQIEQAFRDLKNHRWGWSMRHCRTRSSARLELLLLVATIACLVQQVTGIAGEARGLHRAHQANTLRARRVLSVFLLGGLLLTTSSPDLHDPDIRNAISDLRRGISSHAPA